MKNLNVLIPSIGYVTTPSLVNSLKRNGERKIRIIGVDMDDTGIGPYIPDKFYKVPKRTDPSYIDNILDICIKEKIDIYYALGEEEGIGSAEKMRKFSDLNVSIICPSRDVNILKVISNKNSWHSFLALNNVPVARSKGIYSFDKMEEVIREMGYPEEDVFVKPAESQGGRGSRIVTSKDLSGEYYGERWVVPKISLEEFLREVRGLGDKNFRQLITMEYLYEPSYSVDVLSKNGESYYVIPKVRVKGIWNPTTVGYIDLNKNVMDLISKIVKTFNFSYLQNYEVRFDKNGEPRVCDINPRGGASIVLCWKAGVNMAYYAVKMALGEDVPLGIPVKDKLKMARFYQEIFI